MTESAQTPGLDVFALTLLRDRLLPELLQDDQSEIIYWAGKTLARDVDLHGISAIEAFFQEAGFGTLTLTTQKPTMQKWRLDGPIVEARFSENPELVLHWKLGLSPNKHNNKLDLVPRHNGKHQSKLLR